MIVPEGVIRPILLAKFSVNHIAPSGPAVIPMGVDGLVGIGSSLIVGILRLSATRLAAAAVASRGAGGK